MPVGDLDRRLRWLRISLALYLFAYYGRLLPGFSYYFEPGGMIEPALLHSPRHSPVLWLWSAWGSRLLMALLLAANTLVLLGRHTKAALAAVFVLAVSFHHANPYVIHEPQQLTNLLLLCCLFLRFDGKADRHDELIANALIAYLGAYYLIAGGKKLVDPLWRSGEALWYLIQWPPMATGGAVSAFLLAHPWLCKAGAWFTVLFEVSFLFAAFTPARPALLLGGLLLHALIFFTLEVGSFSYVMIPWYALLLDERTLAVFRRRG